MPIWQESVSEELQKLYLEKAIRALHKAGLNDAVEILLSSRIEISERVHEDKWGFEPLGHQVSIKVPESLRNLLTKNKRHLHKAFFQAFQSVLTNPIIDISFLRKAP